MASRTSRARLHPWCPRRRSAGGLCSGLVALLALRPITAAAAPDEGLRLGGVLPEGPAVRAVTAIHHNPAMLVALPGNEARATMASGLDQSWTARNAVSDKSGLPTTEVGSTHHALNPRVGYFAGAAFVGDPFAVAIAIYDMGSEYRFRSPAEARYHIAPDPDPGCVLGGASRCPPNGGAVSYRHDLSLAAAWNPGPVQLGAAVHLPFWHVRYAYDQDTALANSGDGFPREQPSVAERVGFKGFSRVFDGDDSPSGLDVALTFGIAASFAHERFTIGARYRTFPLRDAGRINLSGVALVCRPGEPAESGVAPCDLASPVRATWQGQLPQQAAIGAAAVVGRSRRWVVDGQAYWIDYCPGGSNPRRCETDGNERLSIVGLDRDTFTRAQSTRYRARQDLFGAAVNLTHDRPNVQTVAGLSGSSPSVRRRATTPVRNDGWRLGATVGAAVRLRQSGFELVPGYAIDAFLPRTVAADVAAFDPAARTRFEASGADLNSPDADAVLRGRARPTNAGRYAGLWHTFSVALRWSDRR